MRGGYRAEAGVLADGCRRHDRCLHATPMAFSPRPSLQSPSTPGGLTTCPIPRLLRAPLDAHALSCCAPQRRQNEFQEKLRDAQRARQLWSRVAPSGASARQRAARLQCFSRARARAGARAGGSSAVFRAAHPPLSCVADAAAEAR